MPTALLIQLIMAGVSELPKLVVALEASAEHSAEEKRAIIADIRKRLGATDARVAAVEIIDV